MKITTIKENNKEIAIVNSNEILISDVQSTLDICHRKYCNYFNEFIWTRL